MWAMTAVSRLALCACLAVSVFPGRLPCLASRVTLAVRADARDVLSIYLSDARDVIYLYLYTSTYRERERDITPIQP